MKRLVSGIKPTGELTLGNYIGAIKQFVKMQQDYEGFIFVADLHALTVYNDPKELKKKIRDIVAMYLACGLNPKYTTLFIQSENMYHTNLAWILECNSYMGELSRMTQFKEKSHGKNNEAISCGLFTYPVLMASDILLYDIDYVPVGVDQKQHVELTRDLAERFNKKYGDTFKIPEPLISKTGTKIMDLVNPTIKMSKSAENKKGVIFLLDDVDIARKKIMSSTTDSECVVKYDPENKPGITNLINIYSSLTDMSIEDVESKFNGKNYGEFKKCVADVVVDFLTIIQAKYNEYINSDVIDKILDSGIEKVNKEAKMKYELVKEKVGLIR